MPGTPVVAQPAVDSLAAGQALGASDSPFYTEFVFNGFHRVYGKADACIIGFDVVLQQEGEPAGLRQLVHQLPGAAPAVGEGAAQLLRAADAFLRSEKAGHSLLLPVFDGGSAAQQQAVKGL